MTEDKTPPGKKYENDYRTRPRSTRAETGGGPINGNTKAFATDEELAKVNEGRAPSRIVERRKICGAKTKTRNAKSAVCTWPAGWRTDHPGYGYCKFHGGTSHAGKVSAAKEMASELIERERAAIAERRRFGGDRTEQAVVDLLPEQALLEEVQRSVAMVRWLEESIGLWPVDGPEDLGGLPVVTAESSRGVPGSTDHHVWMMMYRDERMHMARVSKMTVDAGVSQSMVKIAQVQGAALAKGLRVILDSLGLTALQAEQARSVVPKVLAALASGAIDGLPSSLSATDVIGSSATLVE